MLLSLAGCSKSSGEEYATLAPDIADTFPLKAEAVATNPQLVKSSGPYAVFHTTAGDIMAVLYPEEAPKAVGNFTTLAKAGYYDGSIFYWVVKESLIQSGYRKVSEEEEADSESITGTTGSEQTTAESTTSDVLVEQALTSEDDSDTGKSMWGKDFEDEFDDRLHNFCGALAMANNGFNTNSSEFYMVQSNAIPEDKVAEANMYMNSILYEANIELNQMAVANGGVLTDEQTSAFSEQVQAKIDAIPTTGVPAEYMTRFQAAVDMYKTVGGKPGLDYAHTVFGQVVYGQNIVDAISQVKVDVYKQPKQDIIINSIEILDTKLDYVTID